MKETKKLKDEATRFQLELRILPGASKHRVVAKSSVNAVEVL